MLEKKAVIIGAGIGGLATAIRLAQHGIKVIVYEKNATPGGRCQQIKKGGHVFDSGPTMFIFPQMYERFFSSIGENINDYLKLIRTDPTYRLYFADNTVFTLTSDLKEMKRQLEKIEPGSYGNFLKYMDDAKEHLRLGLEELTFKDFTRPFEYFNFKNLWILFRTKSYITHHAYASSYFRNPKLRAAFTFQDSYVSLNPYNSPPIFSMFPYTELINGNYLPKGGMYEVIRALVKIAQKYGVKMCYQSPVKKIIIENNLVRGVMLDDSTITYADYVIVNADITGAYEMFFPSDPKTNTLRHKKYSCSVIIFHWALDKVFPQLKSHNLFFSRDFRGEFDRVVKGWKPPDNPHFYIQAPVRTDPERAPKGKDTVSVIVPINHMSPEHPVDWGAYKNKLRTYILNRLEETGLRNIGKHIKFEMSITPEDWQKKFNLPYGSVYGLHHSLDQMGYLREKRRHSKYKNVFFVGASTHPGSGLPTVLMSSIFTSNMILKDIKN